MEKKEILTVVLIGVLLLTVAIQTIQLVGLSKTQVVVPSAGSGSSSVNKPVASGSGNVPTSLQNIPSMVGGC